VRSLTVAMDGSLVVAANNSGTCYVWRAMRGSYLTTHFEPLHKLRAHQGGEGLPAPVAWLVLHGVAVF
jgi:G protein beta subunit-like protein